MCDDGSDYEDDFETFDEEENKASNHVKSSTHLKNCSESKYSESKELDTMTNQMENTSLEDSNHASIQCTTTPMNTSSTSKYRQSTNRSQTSTSSMMTNRRGIRSTTSSKAAWEDVLAADVEFGARIGGGGFAIVYKGIWRDRPVAVKSLFDPKVDEALKREFMDELHAMRELDHPHIVQFLGACTRPPKMFFLMELCEGGSLFSFLHDPASAGRVQCQYNDATLIQMAADTADALAYLHGQSPPVIHRDLKSHNLLLTSTGRVKLCDFGLVTTRNSTAGTPNYMAPELLNNAPFSKAVDVYAFGILLWEMFARQVPFHGWRASDIRSHVCHGDRLDIRTLRCPGDILQLIKACWAHDPTCRPSMNKITHQLRHWKPQASNISRASKRIGGGDALDSLLGSSTPKSTR